MKKRVADILVETLIELGINNNFCVVGGGAMHLNNAFVNHNKSIRTVFCHHEQACAFSAEGYAKLTGKIASVSVTSGPGAANTLNAVYSAWVDSTPMFVIAGHPRYDTTVEACGLDLRCRGVQELDIIPMVKGITKFAVMLKNPYDVKKVVYEAYDRAMYGRKGPVWISVPLDVQAMIIEEDDCLQYQNIFEINDDIIDYESVINEIKNSKRPVILTGMGIRYADAMNDFYLLTRKLQIPIVGGALLSDTLPEGYKYYYGMSGNIGPRAGNYILQKSDCILVLGNSMSSKQTGFNISGFAPDAKIIMVDISHDEMRKPGLNIYISIKSDLKHFIPCLIEKLDNTIIADKKWVNYCDSIYKYFYDYDDVEFDFEDRVPAKQFWKIFRDKIDEQTVLALGNSNCTVGIYQYGLKHINQRILTNYNAGSMGCDLPEAIGASVGTDNTVICVTGDGSIMMNLQELQTIKYNKFPIKVVIFSNGGYGAIRQTCINFFNGTYTGCDEKSGISFPSFSDVANTFGFSYLACERCGDLENIIDEFLSVKGNAILEIKQLINDPVKPKIMSKLNSDGTFATPIFTDLSPFLNEKDQKFLDDIEEELYS